MSQTWTDRWRHGNMVDEMNICCPNTQRRGTFMSVMDDRHMRAIIQESYVSLTLFAELLCIAIKLLKKRDQMEQKNIINTLIPAKHNWLFNICLGRSTFFPKSLGKGQEKIHLGGGRVSACYFRLLKNPPVIPIIDNVRSVITPSFCGEV